MQKCINCGKNPYIQYEFGLLCLDCDLKFIQVTSMKIAASERQINHTLDEMDSIFGIYTGGRYPERKKPTVNHIPVTMNNQKIHIEKSIVGSVNTGVIHQLDVSMNSVSQINDEGANKIKEFAEAVLKEEKLKKEEKENIIQQLNFLTQQLAINKESRNRAVIQTVLASIFGLIGFSANLCTIWETVKPFFQQ